MLNAPLPRIDLDEELKQMLLKYCRLSKGDVWTDPQKKHKVACFDAVDSESILNKFGRNSSILTIQDPPYNFIAFNEKELNEFIEWCNQWINVTTELLTKDSSLYVWLGADQNAHYQPLPQFMQMMIKSGFNSRSCITMRNQRGYGTQKNWMAVRQELLYYIKGNPYFNVKADYTDIPKILRGYYKSVNGKKTENIERSKSEFIRAGNVWVDIQQVFYRMQENVNGCYAQKPLKAIERIIEASSAEGDIVIDLFSHAGTTLIAAEKLNRRCFTSDINPIYCEITIRRLENLRKNKITGWQNSNPFAHEIKNDKKLKDYLQNRYDLKYDFNSNEVNV